MSLELEYSRADLAMQRERAKEVGVALPKGLTALRADRHQYLVEWRDANGKYCRKYVRASNAYGAKASFIERWVEGDLI
jgi:hypothetical protein